MNTPITSSSGFAILLCLLPSVGLRSMINWMLSIELTWVRLRSIHPDPLPNDLKNLLPRDSKNLRRTPQRLYLGLGPFNFQNWGYNLSGINIINQVESVSRTYEFVGSSKTLSEFYWVIVTQFWSCTYLSHFVIQLRLNYIVSPWTITLFQITDNLLYKTKYMHLTTWNHLNVSTIAKCYFHQLSH